MFLTLAGFLASFIIDTTVVDVAYVEGGAVIYRAGKVLKKIGSKK